MGFTFAKAAALLDAARGLCALEVALVENGDEGNVPFYQTNPPFSGWFLFVSVGLIKG